MDTVYYVNVYKTVHGKLFLKIIFLCFLHLLESIESSKYNFYFFITYTYRHLM